MNLADLAGLLTRPTNTSFNGAMVSVGGFDLHRYPGKPVRGLEHRIALPGLRRAIPVFGSSETPGFRRQEPAAK